MRFKKEFSLPWAEIARRLGAHPETVRRWRDKRVHPSMQHMMELRALADALGAPHILTD